MILGVGFAHVSARLSRERGRFAIRLTSMPRFLVFLQDPCRSLLSRWQTGVHAYVFECSCYISGNVRLPARDQRARVAGDRAVDSNQLRSAGADPLAICWPGNA